MCPVIEGVNANEREPVSILLYFSDPRSPLDHLFPNNILFLRLSCASHLASFPTTVQSSETIATFCKKLKMYLFEIVFLPYIFGSPKLL